MLYKEFVGFKAWQWALYIIGVLTLFAGIKVAAARLAAVEAAMNDKDIAVKKGSSQEPVMSPNTAAQDVTNSTNEAQVIQQTNI